MKKFGFTAVFFGVLGLVFLLQESLFATHSWGNYHWARTQNPFTLKLGDNVTSVWEPILSTTSSDWTQSNVLNTTIVPGGARRRKRCRPTSGRAEVCNYTYGNNGWLGIAQIWVSGNHIVKGVTKLNDTYFKMPAYNTTAWRNHVMCQEVGHVLGLDHQDENFNNPNLNTCMDYTNNPTSNQHPNSHDYQMLQTIYSHVDSFITVKSAPPPAMDQVDFSSPSQWGVVIEKSAEGRPLLYMLDFGGGHKIFTHVFWVPRARDGSEGGRRVQ